MPGEFSAVPKDVLDRLDRIEKKQSEVTRTPIQPTPWVTTGPIGQDSQRFSFAKALIHCVFHKEPSAAKFEYDVMSRLQKAIINSSSLPQGASQHGLWLPINFEHLGEAVMNNEDGRYVKSVIEASAATIDPEERDWLIRKGIVYKKTQSAYTDSTGGTLVAPPVMGPVIPLIRPEAAIQAAGATSQALPPNGRYTAPRITGAPSVQAVAESEDAPESDLSTDQMVLTAKKIAGMTRIPEEATNFTSGTIDTLVKQELDRSLGLKMDAYAFYGTGTTSIPAGLTSSAYSGAIINVATAYATGAGIGANGNSLLPQYGDLLPALIEERSFGLDANEGVWIMRPSAYASAVGVRSDGPVPGDQRGPMVDILRRFSETSPNQWRGRRTVRTTNIKGDKTKGTGTNLSDVFFGIWKHCITATYGAIQFQMGHDGNTFKRGQYLIRAVMYGDVGFTYPTAFLYYPDVLGVQDQI